ncbi:signal peptide peptidase SppA [Treponema sp.]|uniref:signal peptide peptidase SppA n=1 Tax=Treponema sp. TaxID=166 RepID=UPI003FD8EA73
MNKKNTKYGLAVLLTITLISILMGFFKIFSTDFFSISKNSKKVEQPAQNCFIYNKDSNYYIAVVNISGVIQEKGSEYNQKWLLNTIRSLKNDKKNAGILLYVNSPGGTVYHADEAYLELLKYKETGKKIYAYFAEMATSGGYYIGCAADKIYANRNTITGSIGVISASSIDATDFLEKIGIKSITIHTGKNKNMLNYNEKPTEEQIQIMQSLSDEAYEQFTQIVSESRNMNIKDVQKIADGRIYSAKQAKENGLIDEIFTFDEAKKSIKSDFESDNLSFKTFRYEKSESLRSILLEGFSSIKNPASAFGQTPLLSYGKF